MCSHGFIGAICMPSELIPAWMPLSTIIQHDVVVIVDDARDGGTPFQVDDALVPVTAVIAVSAVLEPDDAPVSDRQRRSHPALRVHGVDLSVHEHEVGELPDIRGARGGANLRMGGSERSGDTGRSGLQQVPTRQSLADTFAIVAHDAPPSRETFMNDPSTGDERGDARGPLVHH